MSKKSRSFYADHLEGKNEQLKSAATILRTVGFGALGVGLWEPLSERSSDSILITLLLILMSFMLFYGSHKMLGQIESEDTWKDK